MIAFRRRFVQLPWEDSQKEERKVACRGLAMTVFGMVVLLTAAVSPIGAAQETVSGKTTASVQATRPAVKAPPSFDAGYKAYRKGKWDEAVAALERAVKEEPKHALSFHFLSRAYLKKKRPKDAAKMAKRAATLAPTYGRSQRALGLAQLALRDYKGAAESFRKADKLEPKNFWNVNNLGYALVMTGQYKEARKPLERAVVLDAKQAMTWNTLGVVRLRTDDAEGAVKAFEKALELDPKHSLARGNLARAKATLSASK